VQSFYQEDGKSPFKHMPWKHGSMHFSYENVRPCPLVDVSYNIFTYLVYIPDVPPNKHKRSWTSGLPVPCPTGTFHTQCAWVAQLVGLQYCLTTWDCGPQPYLFISTNACISGSLTIDLPLFGMQYDAQAHTIPHTPFAAPCHCPAPRANSHSWNVIVSTTPSSSVQVGSTVEVCKLTDLVYTNAFLALIGIFGCDVTTDVEAAYERYQAAIVRATQAISAPLLASRLFGTGSEAAVMRCRAAVRKNKKMEGLVAMEDRELKGSMFSFCMLDFASCLLMNVAEVILKLKYQEMSLDTATDAAFRCGPPAGPSIGLVPEKRSVESPCRHHHLQLRAAWPWKLFAWLDCSWC
jgi:hypothetical protein